MVKVVIFFFFLAAATACIQSPGQGCNLSHSRDSTEFPTVRPAGNSKMANFFFFFFFVFSRAAPAAYGGSQARGLISYTTATVNMGSEPCLQPTPQLKATPDP